MGQQQLLILVLGVAVVGLAIAVGVNLFAGNSISANKDGIILDITSLSRYAYGYKLRPVPFGGGGNFYTGFGIPSKFDVNENATYSSVATQQAVVFTAVSKYGYGMVTATLDSNGVLSNFTYTGEFN